MSVNKIILIGNVGKEPDVRYLDKGGAVANFTLATSERGYTAANGTQVPERTEWHNIVLWRGLAEIAEKYVHKGTKLYIEGKVRTRSYDDSQGNKRYITEVWGDQIELLGAKQENPNPNTSSPTSPPVRNQPQTLAETHLPQAQMETSAVSQENLSLNADESDDLPF
jgi:single-strand DNA-binding protein